MCRSAPRVAPCRAPWMELRSSAGPLRASGRAAPGRFASPQPPGATSVPTGCSSKAWRWGRYSPRTRRPRREAAARA
eukprot:527573-Lingulodinium_polyedra.AAC.1